MQQYFYISSTSGQLLDYCPTFSASDVVLSVRKISIDSNNSDDDDDDDDDNESFNM